MKKFPLRPILFTALLLVLLAAACSPITLPTTTGSTPSGNGAGGDTSNQEGSPGSTIPQDGPISTPGSGTITDNTRDFNPLITVNASGLSEGSEMVVDGQGFPANTTVRIYLGRPANLQDGADAETQSTPAAGTAEPPATEQPDSGDQNGSGQGQSSGYTAAEPLVTTMSNDRGAFSVHTVLPRPIPQGAVINGFATLWAVSADQNAQANTVIEVAAAGVGNSEGSGQGSSGSGQVDLSQLDFDFNTSVLPYLSGVAGQDLQPEDISVTGLEEVDWSDGCLELGGQGEMCTQQIVPGYRFSVDVDGQNYEIRSDRSGRVVRLYQQSSR